MNPFGELLQSDAFSDLDRQFARFLNGKASAPAPEIELAAALVSRNLREGHVCLNLPEVAGRALSQRRRPNSPQPALPASAPWQDALRTSGVVGTPGDFKPLILDDGGRLYLHRYWRYEEQLALRLRSIAARELPAVDDPAIHAALERYFPPTSRPDPDQRSAAERALRRQLTILTGGPGTGKTRTIAVILSMLAELPSARPLRIALAAPTGKAAARMQESIAALRDSLPISSAARRSFPDGAFTLHRLLRVQPGNATPHYHRKNPVPYDVVIVDEASMVDLALMAKLFDALGPDTRVLLAGDRDQLASVEAGAVLGDICHGLNRSQTDAPLVRGLVALRTNHRFQQGHALNALHRAIHGGDADGAVRALSTADPADPSLRQQTPPAPGQIETALCEPLCEWLRKILTAGDPANALRVLGEFRILSALRVGPHGSDALNHHAERVLGRDGLIRNSQAWYHGRPVLVTRNDPALGLSNGDTGIALATPGAGLRVWFSLGGDIRNFAPAQLPPHETSFAITVHKSQGSEFDRVLLVLPDKWNPVLSRELIYTGVTRARTSVELWTRPEIFRQAIATPGARTSGLREKLWPGL